MLGRITRTLAAIGAGSAALLTLAACTSSGPGSSRTVTVTHEAPAVAPSQSSTAPSTEPATASSSSSAPVENRTVHVWAMQSDHAVYGVGMPIVLYFSPLPTDSTEFTKAVKVTVDGRPADGAWFWEQPTHDEVVSHTIEAHYRLPDYWPAHSRIHASFPIKGLSAGKGLVYSGALTSLDFSIGAKHVATVDGHAERMRVYSDGKLIRKIPVSLGEAAHRTYSGIKLVMQKGEDVPGTNKRRPRGKVLMSGRGYTNLPVAWSVRVTRSGEYVHAAPWNSLIGRRSTSHGCTNLSTDRAKWFYNFARLGDVVSYANTGGRPMPVWDGLGDWNVPWSQWAQGGSLANH